MRNKRLGLFITLLLTLILCVNGKNIHSQTCDSANFVSHTQDLMIWQGKIYFMDDTPLRFFAGYDTLYSKVTAIVMPGHPLYKICKDTNNKFAVYWSLYNDSLYLTDIRYLEDTNPRDPYGPMEALIGYEFQKHSSIKGSTIHLSYAGVIPAKWMNGKMRIKKYLGGWFDDEEFEMWKSAPFYELKFKNGVLIHYRIK